MPSVRKDRVATKITFLLVAFPLSISTFLKADTCTGIAPKSDYTPVTPKMNFMNCSSRCGKLTPPDVNWRWNTSGNLSPWGGFLPSSYGYTDIVYKRTSETCPMKNREFPYQVSGGANSLVGLSIFTNGTTQTDLWLKTDQRVIHVAGGEEIKCNANADGVNDPFIIIADGAIRVGWSQGTPTPGMIYTGSSRKIPLLAGENPISFALSTSGSPKECSLYTYSYVPTFVDSGLRVQGKRRGETYPLAAESGRTPASPLRIENSGTLGLVLVDPTDPDASPFRVQTKDGTKAVRIYR